MFENPPPASAPLSLLLHTLHSDDEDMTDDEECNGKVTHLAAAAQRMKASITLPASALAQRQRVGTMIMSARKGSTQAWQNVQAEA